MDRSEPFPGPLGRDGMDEGQPPSPTTTVSSQNNTVHKSKSYYGTPPPLFPWMAGPATFRRRLTRRP